ncbi:MAG: hypothetical protein A3I11_07505 [Elusimicrobia bacterium RIFCSPLOWO2_02_FULL_39_32]|nr:MAG: hypothetical protein A2034_00070 [Elusimicrobia bacterium GWA2_38_7]OGR81402.1 MAG: hypothetical protein A3B80_05120 [Elusimicrobia bacterium RIFCSPHIGHO2_02_FULL_39_36]OGR92031.1 MAG: hypothetical protein A3I11_07505 [Elusimicrobia bacterium RIFCSPLOWO2_02_FULL_39_32]OGR98678.1 MAG: hypothetical protein A3G85_04925 [Elusimicrobia bacterium RIFCSPLOWO2_12_FULL_39_28]OGZ59780.1 MAG: hypothetical protein A3E58_00235 [Candidatus Spechtbacteria bacterium RIFCSPHIGHO2_12_FULL_38_30]
MSDFFYKNHKAKKGKGFGTAGFLSILFSFILILSLIVPDWTGNFGRSLHSILFRFSGYASLFFPITLFWLGVEKIYGQKKLRLVQDGLLLSVLYLFFACLFTFLPLENEEAVRLGGSLGYWIYLFMIKQFGKLLTFLISFGILMASSLLLARISPLYVLNMLKDKVKDDLQDWKEEREKLKEKKELQNKLNQKEFEPFGQLPKLAVSSSKIETKPMIIQKNFKSEGTTGSKDLPLLSKEAETLNGKSAYQGYLLPTPDLLEEPVKSFSIDQDELYANGNLLENTLEQFNVKAKVIDIHPGPVITRYDLTPAPGVRVQAIETLSNDIALVMKAQSLRVLAPVPGKAAVGVEISNSRPATVYLRELMESSVFQKSPHLLPLGIGKGTEGDTFVTDLTAMPHLLIAGATGSGKSVCIHTLILSILFRFKPDEVKLLLIDPKRLELPLYDGIPHLFDPAAASEKVKVITSPKETVQSLKKLVEEMEDRYRSFAQYGVRNIDSFNEKMRKSNQEETPYIIVIIDELADLMITVGKEIEDLIQRLAQMARAVGIHLVLATQRPSVDVITGVIKANLPSRIAFQVLSKIDSRVILDTQGAENLLGRGDMLFLATSSPKPARLQGCFVSEKDVSSVVKFIVDQNFKPQYVFKGEDSTSDSITESEENIQLLIRAARVVRDTEKVSGDLLRADKEIGSRYDWALTLLKKKGLIEKPKDTNRWKIHLERLEEFLISVDKKENQG